MKNKKAPVGTKLVASLTKNVTYQQVSDNYWIRGLIQAIPAVGGTFDTWFFQFAEKEYKKHIEQSLRYLSQHLRTIEEKIDVEYIGQHIEEYASLFRKYLGYIAIEHQKELRTKFTNAISILLTETYSKKRNKDIYLSKLAELNLDHLLMLKIAYDYTFDKGIQDFEKTKSSQGFIKTQLKKKGLDDAAIMALQTDLESKGLLNNAYHPGFGGGSYTLHISPLGILILNLVS